MSFSIPKPSARSEHGVCVVGSGFAGVAVATRLAEQGVDTVLLEAGGRTPPPVASEGSDERFPYAARGEAVFPLLFAGAAIGALTTFLVPGLDLATAEIAGLAASTTVGLKKPVAAVLICALLIGQPAWGPLIVGATLGLFVSRATREQTH